MPRETHLPELFQLFRQHGYDGVSLANISAATGLGKASLYHHFPGGKTEMIQATLTYAQSWFEENIFRVLRQDLPVKERFEQMCDRLDKLYASGDQTCLLISLTAGSPHEAFHTQVQQCLTQLIEAIAAALTETGLAADTAQERSEDAVMTIQGALILSRGLDDSQPFKRAISQIPERLCEGL